MAGPAKVSRLSLALASGAQLLDQNKCPVIASNPSIAPC
jgi:hypothetical protein